LGFASSSKKDEAGMAELSIDPQYLRTLIVKVRTVMGKEGTVSPDKASNFTDDAAPPESLQPSPVT
jgi:hypothetical protein